MGTKDSITMKIDKQTIKVNNQVVATITTEYYYILWIRVNKTITVETNQPTKVIVNL